MMSYLFKPGDGKKQPIGSQIFGLLSKIHKQSINNQKLNQQSRILHNNNRRYDNLNTNSPYHGSSDLNSMQ